jgi:hypothetical protein
LGIARVAAGPAKFDQHTLFQIAPLGGGVFDAVLVPVDRSHNDAIGIAPELYPVTQPDFLPIRVLHCFAPSLEASWASGSIVIAPAGSSAAGTAPTRCQKHL